MESRKERKASRGGKVPGKMQKERRGERICQYEVNEEKGEKGKETYIIDQ